jgi:hypothetical protein
MHELAPRRAAVERRLASVRRGVRWQLVIEGLAWTLGTAVALAALSLAVDWMLRLGRPTRLGLGLVSVAVLLAVGYRLLVRPLSVRLANLDLALLLDRNRPGVAQEVATVVQLPSLLDNGYSASPSMIRAAVVEAAGRLEQTDFAGMLDLRRRGRFAAALAGAILLPVAFTLVAPQVTVLWANRWLLGRAVRWPQSTYLTVVGLPADGRLLVPRGEPLVLKVQASADVAARESNRLFLAGRREPVFSTGDSPPPSAVPDQVSIQYRSPGGAKQAVFTRFGDNDFRYELPPVHEPLEVSIRGGDDWLDPIAIEPIDRPAVTRLELTSRRPGRSDPETHTFSGSDTQLLFLRKTDLEMRVTSSMPLASASLKATVGSVPPLQRIDAENYIARWTMQEAIALELQLLADQRAGGLASKPYVFTIGLLKDREPRVTIRSSGVGPRVTPMARIPIALRALDDFGLGEIGAEMERTSPTQDQPAEKAEPERIAIEDPEAGGATELDRQQTVALRDIAPPPGTLVKLRGLAADTCAEGPQTGYSRWLSFRVVTPEELFHEILMRQRAERAKFRGALNTAKSQSDSLDIAAAPEDVDGLVRRHQVVERQVWQIAKRLDESLTEMTLNELGGSQAIELLQTRVITPMRQLHAEEMSGMRRLLDRMAVGKPSLDEHLPQAQELQKQIVTAMERILEQMSQWESFVDVVNQLREIIKLQNAVLDSTEEVRKQQTKKLFDE